MELTAQRGSSQNIGVESLTSFELRRARGRIKMVFRSCTHMCHCWIDLAMQVAVARPGKLCPLTGTSRLVVRSGNCTNVGATVFLGISTCHSSHSLYRYSTNCPFLASLVIIFKCFNQFKTSGFCFLIHSSKSCVN